MRQFLFPHRLTIARGTNAARRKPSPPPHPFRLLELVLLLDCDGAGARIVAERVGADGTVELKCARLVDGCQMWAKPQRLRHLNGPRLLLIDGGKTDELSAKLRRALQPSPGLTP